MRHPIIVLAAIAATSAACAREPRIAADVVVTRAAIWTGSRDQPSASGLAIVGDRIIALGASDDMKQYIGSSTTVVDANGRRVVPGFHARARVIDGGIALDQVDLHDAATPREFARRIAERARKRPGEWMVGGNWESRFWKPPTPPTRHLIDDATNGAPVFVHSYDRTMALANSAALGRAGVTERTPSPPRGEIARDARGFPSGLLRGSAIALVERVVPKPTPEERELAVKRTLQYAATQGVTSLEDVNPTAEDVALYTRLASRRELTVRITTATTRSDGKEWPRSALNPMTSVSVETIAARTGGDVLAPGQTADLVILSGDVLAPDRPAMPVGVLLTMVGGKIVHQRNP